MGYYFKCPKELFKSPLLESEKPVSAAVALVVIIAQAAYGFYRIEGADGNQLEIRPGQFPVDIGRLKNLTGWSENRLNRFLFHLHEHQVLGRRAWNGVTIATVCPEAVADLPPLPHKTRRLVPKIEKHDEKEQDSVENAEESAERGGSLEKLARLSP